MLSGAWGDGRKPIAMTVGGVETTDAVASVVLTDDLNGDSMYVKIGSTVAAHARVTVKQPSRTYADKEIALSAGGIPLGEFTVTAVESTDGQSVLDAYDAMGTKMETPYYPSSASSTALGVLKEICAKTGVPLGDTTGITDVPVSGLQMGYTCREMTGFMAALLGRNAHIDRYGALVLRWYTAADFTVTADDYYSGGLTKNDGNFTIGKIECTVTSVTTTTETDNEGNTTAIEEADTQTLTAGDGATGISLDCNLMTQSILDGIYTRIGGFTFRPLTVKFFGDARLEAGDLITVTDLSGASYTVPVMKVVHECDGGCVTTVTAAGQTESAGSSAGGVLSQAVSRLTAELGIFMTLEAENLTAVNAKIYSLKADYAALAEMTAEKASIEDLEAVEAYIQALDVDGLTARIATIEKAYITTADVETLLADKAYITTADVETLLAEKAYITTAEVQTLLADKADIADLTAALARIGTIEADYIKTETLETVTLSLENLIAGKADIADLNAVVATINNLDTVYATVDLLNVSQESVEQLFVTGGLVTDDLTAVTANVTKYLTGVTIVGDVIQANTLTADKLILTGEDGLIYEINATASGLTATELTDAVYQSAINGTCIVANSITAGQIAANTITGNEIAANTITAANIVANTITANELAAGSVTTSKLAAGSVTADKISVTDLYALGATIGGWTIGESAIYNGTDSMTSTQVGTYIGLDGIRQYASDSAYVDIADGVLTAYGATLYGSMHTVNDSNGTSASLTSGSLYLYNGNKFTSLAVNTWLGSGGTDYGSVILVSPENDVMGTEAMSFFAVGIASAADAGYTPGYVLNNGLNPDGYTERNIFYGAVRAVGATTLSSTLAVTGITTLNNYIHVNHTSTYHLTMGGGSNFCWIDCRNSSETVQNNIVLYPTYTAMKAVTMSGTLTVSGAAILSSTLSVAEAAVIASRLTVSGVIYGGGTLLTGGKAAWNDGVAGAFLGSDGGIQLTHGSSGAYIGFHYAGSTSAGVTLTQSASDQLSVNGRFNITGSATLNSVLYAKSHFYISNNAYLYWYNASGTAVTMLTFGSGDEFYVGNGSYPTHIHGSSIYLYGHSTAIGSLITTDNTSGVSLISNTNTDILSISLPAGSWVVTGMIYAGNPGSARSVWISLYSVSGTFSAVSGAGGYYASGQESRIIATRLVRNTSTTTYYLVAKSTVDITIGAAYIYAMRVA